MFAVRLVCSFVVVCGVGAALAAAAQQQATQPNVVFILVDDLGWRDLGIEGSTFYRSPRIDALARDGVRFERAYAASRVCSPSRASIMTGQTPPRHGITTWIGDKAGESWRTHRRHDSHLPADYRRELDHDAMTLPEAFRDAGYATFFAGKWHLGGAGSWPEDHGFDINIGGWDVGSPKGGYFAPWDNPNLPSGPDGESLTLRLANETASFIEQSAGEPFFAFLSFYAVHGPIQTTRDRWARFRDDAESLGSDDQRFEFDRRANVRVVQDCPVYAGMIETVDDAVGIVLDQLEASGIADNTIVCFTSDNGGASSGDDFSTSSLPLRGGKGTQWEGGLRVPASIRAPGIDAGTVATPMHGSDWMPTLLSLAGIEADVPQTMDGTDLTTLLRGGDARPSPLFFHYPHYGNQGGEPSSIMIDWPWKLIAYHEDGRAELYNLQADPGERTDLARLETERTDALRERLDAWLAETDATFPASDPTFDGSKRSARLDRIRTDQRAKLEQRHAGYVTPDFDPGNCWWGSDTGEGCD